jgi:hypothetical protein
MVGRASTVYRTIDSHRQTLKEGRQSFLFQEKVVQMLSMYHGQCGIFTFINTG